MAEVKVGDACVHRFEPGVTAKVVFIDGDGVTVLVDGYAASDFYSTAQFERDWELLNG